MTIMDNAADDTLVPYQLPFPADALLEIVIPRVTPDDERMWVPQAKKSGFAPYASTDRRAIG
jgi:2,4'-dihydroxyacetophenone dioxygenase